LAQASQTVEHLLNSALEHHHNGRLAEAGQFYRTILAANPAHPDCLHLLGMIAYQAGDFDTAADLIRRAIATHAKAATYHMNLGTILHAQGKLDEAETLFRHALALKPDVAEAHVNLGNVLQARGEFDASVLCYERALALKPDSAEAHGNLGNAHQSQGQTDLAIACYQRALAIRPDYAEVYCNLGNASQAEDRLDEAVAFYQHALTLKPGYPGAFYNLGNVRRAQGDVEQALLQFANALALRPDYTQAAFAEALAHLLGGDFTTGWQKYERRWHSIDHDTPRRSYSQPLWAGGKLASGSLLLWGEQGVGDEVMFAGLIPDATRSGNQCILDCDPRLQSLFARSFPSAVVLSGCGPESHPELQITSQLPTGSLPSLFRSTPSAFAATGSPYLIADPAQQQRLLARYTDGRTLIGLAWYTNNRKTGRQRSIDLSLLAPLFPQPGDPFRWISLQYGDHDQLEQQASAAAAPLLVDRSVDPLADMDLFAAQIAAMDLVITIDNSTAHMAGALGVPVWVLLPFAADWRWLLARDDSPWYPTMRLFRQPKPGDWQSVVQSVHSALAKVNSDPPAESRPQ
jgi:tetratricopeptide (TPR) repeat protein